jgi:hypothetical protein
MTGDGSFEVVAGGLSAEDLALLEVCAGYPAPKFAGAWVRGECARRGIAFHQTWLGRLVRHGLLIKEDDARGGHRRYYRIGDRERVERVLTEAGGVGASGC